jgi:hypothetical protein
MTRIPLRRKRQARKLPFPDLFTSWLLRELDADDTVWAAKRKIETI